MQRLGTPTASRTLQQLRPLFDLFGLNTLLFHGVSSLYWVAFLASAPDCVQISLLRWSGTGAPSAWSEVSNWRSDGNSSLRQT